MRSKWRTVSLFPLVLATILLVGEREHGLLSPPPNAAAQQSTVHEVAVGTSTIAYRLISTARVSRTVFDFTFAATIRNSSLDLPPTLATLESHVAATSIVDGELRFPATPLGTTTPGSDTFTIRQERSIPFDPDSLVWSIEVDSVLPTPVPDPCSTEVKPCKSAFVDPFLFISVLDQGVTSTRVTRGEESVLSLSWVPINGSVQLQITLPGDVANTFLEKPGPPPSLDTANAAAAAFVILNRAETPAAPRSTAAVAGAEPAPGNTAGCDQLHFLDGDDFGACCDQHDVCIDRDCKGPFDNGNLLECEIRAGFFLACFESCGGGSTCRIECLVSDPPCSNECNVCHLTVMQCFATEPLPGPSKCKQKGNCGEPQQCIIDDTVITNPCECQQAGKASVDPCDGGGGGFGDPHLLTFDRLAYDFQAVGEFVLARSTEDSFEVQVRTTPWRNLRVASVITAVAMRLADERVGIYLGQDLPLRVNGEPTNLGPGESMAFASGAEVRNESAQYIARWPDGREVVVSQPGDYLNVRVNVSESVPGRFSGLLGDFDGSAQDDLETRAGDELGLFLTFEALYEVFGESWRTTQEDSLFDYEPGESTASLTDRSFPGSVVSSTSLSPAAREHAEEVCRSAGILDGVPFEWCVLDVGLTNDADFAELPSSLINPVMTITTNPADPNVTDSDGDGLTDADERGRGSNPFVRDSDDDGKNDGQEVAAGTDPLEPTASAQIPSLGPLSGSVDAASETDLFSFAGNAGEVVDLTLTETSNWGGTIFDSGANDARATVFSPTGAQLTQFDSNAQQQLTLPVSGSYLVRVQANNLMSAGSYNLNLTRLFPADPPPTPLACANLLPGSVDAASEVDLFAFAGNAGDVVDLTLTETSNWGGNVFDSGANDARATVFSPTGVQVDQFDSNVQQHLTLTETGAYLIRLNANDLVSTGSYNLGLTCVLPSSPPPTPLACADLLPGSVDAASEVDLFAFAGNAGDVVDLTLTETSNWGGNVFDSGANDARATVFSPTGVQVDQFDSNVQQHLTLTETGVYLIRLNANDLVSTGSYNLGLTCVLPSSPPPTPLACANLLPGSVDAASEVDLFAFAGNAGDVVDLTLTETSNWGGNVFDSGANDARATVFSPTGVQVDQFDSNVQQHLTLTETGVYLIRLNANDLVSTGSYNLGLTCVLPSSPPPTPLACADLLPGSVDAASEVDLFAFAGNAGDVVDLTLTETSNWGGNVFDSGANDARATVFSPTGAQVVQFDSNAQQQAALAETGSYLIRVNANNLVSTGSYEVGLTCSAAAAARACGLGFEVSPLILLLGWLRCKEKGRFWLRRDDRAGGGSGRSVQP